MRKTEENRREETRGDGIRCIKETHMKRKRTRRVKSDKVFIFVVVVAAAIYFSGGLDRKTEAPESGKTEEVKQEKVRQNKVRSGATGDGAGQAAGGEVGRTAECRAGQSAGHKAECRAGQTTGHKAESRTGKLIEYQGYVVAFDEESRIPEWVRYELTAEETDGVNTRKGKSFRRDETAGVRQAADDDYRNSGWSRGHMAPAADFKWSDEAMAETFYFTNCCPQNQSLNAGQWNTLEEKVRMWAGKFGKVHVVTGPIVGENIYGTIGENRVTVPDAFFKAVYSIGARGCQSVAFVMYNRPKNENLQGCAMSVDSLETILDLDLFSEVPDPEENRMEAQYSLKDWGI